MGFSGYVFLTVCVLCAGGILYAISLLEHLKNARLRIIKLESELKIITVELNHARIAQKNISKINRTSVSDIDRQLHERGDYRE